MLQRQQKFTPTGAPKSKRKLQVEEGWKAFTDEKIIEAWRIAEPLLKKSPRDPEVLRLVAFILEHRGYAKKAKEFAQRALPKSKSQHQLQLLIARCERILGNTDDCISICDKLIRRNPNDVLALIMKGGALEEAGRAKEARQCLEPVMAAFEREGKTPIPISRYEWAKLLVQEKKHDEAIRVLSDNDGSGPTMEKAGLGTVAMHLKAKAYDRKGDYPAAYEAARQANDMSRVEFSGELYEEQVAALIENWSAEKLPRFPHSNCESELPVFVAGMPRSGTSLIDQIIDAHPKGAGVGELGTIEAFARKLSMVYDPDNETGEWFRGMNDRTFTRVADKYIREIQKLSPPGVERVVNKALGNNKLVGLLALLFPKTRIIHAIRDPRDVAVSCFMGGFNNNLHAWTTRIDWVARAWEQSMRMMDHWKHVLDVPILDVHYERLVNDPATEFPRLIEFLGLEWDDRCRDFYKSKRTVRTLSYDQVNRPLYTTSAGRHANYIQFMQDVEFPDYDPFSD